MKIMHLFKFGSICSMGCYLLICCTLMSCDDDGEAPFALWQRYNHPKGDFSFYYMAPPFNLGPNSTDAHPVLVVDRFSSLTDGGLDARIRVEAWVGQRTQEAELIARRAGWEAKGYRFVETHGYTNYFGHEGQTFVVRWNEHWAQEIIYSYGERSVAISVWTNERGSQKDIELLLAGFRPGHGNQ